MFSTSPTNFNAAPNSNVDTVSLGLPGALPVVNSKGVEGAVKIGLALTRTNDRLGDDLNKRDACTVAVNQGARRTRGS